MELANPVRRRAPGEQRASPTGRGSMRAGRSPLFPAMLLSGKGNSEQEAGPTYGRQTERRGKHLHCSSGSGGAPLVHPLQRRVCGSRQAGTSPFHPSLGGSIVGQRGLGPRGTGSLPGNCPLAPVVSACGSHTASLGCFPETGCLLLPQLHCCRKAVLVLIWVLRSLTLWAFLCCFFLVSYLML